MCKRKPYTKRASYQEHVQESVKPRERYNISQRQRYVSTEHSGEHKAYKVFAYGRNGFKFSFIIPIAISGYAIGDYEILRNACCVKARRYWKKNDSILRVQYGMTTYGLIDYLIIPTKFYHWEKVIIPF